MKRKILIVASLALLITSLFLIKENQTTPKAKNSYATKMDNHPFRKSLQLSKEERKAQGLAPNKYFEQEYLHTMNPETGKTYPEKLIALHEQMQAARTPGDATDNAWVERGPNNVPGRTRAMLYDPNDATHKRVFAGGVSGGLWVIDNIEDANATWQRVNVAETMVVSSITADVNDSNTLYIGTGEPYVGSEGTGNGVWKSTDGGTTWNHIFGGSSGATYFINDAKVNISTPSAIVGDYIAIKSSGFGPDIPTGGVSGDFILANDSGSAPTEGCGSFGGNATGKIAIIDRGSCNFTVKVKNAQNAGAIGAIIIQSLDDNPFGMGGTDATVTIPSVMISKADGELIKNALASQTVHGTISPVVTSLPAGINLIPGKFHVNDIVTRNNGGTTEIYAAITESYYISYSNVLGGEFGIYKSTDGGTSWTHIDLPLTADGNPSPINDLYIAPNNKIYAGSIASSSYRKADGQTLDGGGRIFSSTDGNTFTQKYAVANGNRVELAGSHSNSNKIYAMIHTTNGTRLYKTTAGFAFPPSQTTLPNDPAFQNGGQGWYDLAIAVDPNNDNKLAIGGNYVYKTINGGTSWQKVTHYYSSGSPGSYVHVDIHNIVYHPTDSNKGLIGNDGGVYYVSNWSTAQNSSTAIQSRANNYNTTQFYRGAIGQDVANEKFLGGAQDNGTNFINNATSGINSSTAVGGGDGMLCFIDKDNQYMVTSVYQNAYTRVDMNGNNPVSIENDQTEGTFVNQADLDDNLDILYTNASKFDTASSTWNVNFTRFSNLTTSPTRAEFTDAMITRPPAYIKVSPYTTSSTTLFIGTDSGSIYKVTNANTTPVWTDLTPPAYDVSFHGSISSINFGANENEILVTFQNYGVISIYYTEDGGTTWQNKEGNLPDLPVKDIMMNPLLNDEVIIATDLGVWRTDNFKDSSPSWHQAYNGMSNVKVSSFDLRTADNTVLAATYGRGFFTAKFTAAPLGTQEFENNTNAISIYPTVSNGSFTLKTISNNTLGNVQMDIFDITGKRVYTKEVNLANEVSTSINVSAGTYIVKLKGANVQESHKIIIK